MSAPDPPLSVSPTAGEATLIQLITQQIPFQDSLQPLSQSQPQTLPPTSPQSVQPPASYLVLLKIKPDHLNLSSYQFLETLYQQYLSPTPICALCRQPIQNLKEWFSFTCPCPVYYHTKCGCDDSFQELACTQCHDSRDIYSYNQFPAKFLSTDLFQRIYQKTVQDLPPDQHLRAYRLWFGTINGLGGDIHQNLSGCQIFFTPPLLNLHQYLQPHNPNETMEFLDCLLKKHQIVSYDPAITVRNVNKNVDIEYDTKKIPDTLYYQLPAMLSLKNFRKKLYQYSYGLIDEQFPYSSQTAIVGGGVHKCLEKRIPLDQVPPYCDLDIFICHPDQKVLSRETRKIIKYFRDKLEDQLFWMVRGNVINLLIPGYNRSFQIFLFRNTLPYILHKFDFSHTQFLYNGREVLTTLAGLEYARTLVSIHSGYYDIHFPKRFLKAKDMHLCLALPQDKHISTRLPTIQKIDYWYPSYSDSLDQVQLHMRDLHSIPRRFVTQGKPFRIHYGKIPIEYHHNRICHNQNHLESDLNNQYH